MAGSGRGDPSAVISTCSRTARSTRLSTVADFRIRANFGNASLSLDRGHRSPSPTTSRCSTPCRIERRSGPRFRRRPGFTGYDRCDGAVRHLAVGAGKERTSTWWTATTWGSSTRPLTTSTRINRRPGGSVFSTPAYFNGRFITEPRRFLKAIPFTNARLSATPSSSAKTFPYPGTTPAFPQRHCQWDRLGGREFSPAVLHAYDASNLTSNSTTRRWRPIPRPVRRRQQVHRPDDRKWQGLRRYADRSGRLRRVGARVADESENHSVRSAASRSIRAPRA